MLTRRLEEAALNSWPSLRQMLFDGWVLRFSRGYTKRANSVNPLYGSTLDVTDKIVECERIYTEQGLPPIFRLTPFSSPPELDRVLERRGYARIDPTLVLALDLTDHGLQPTPSAGFRDVPLDEWMEAFYQLSASPPETRRPRRDILQAILSRRLLALRTDSLQPVACGLGVLENVYFGLFGLMTDPAQRGRGHGTALLGGMLGWARENGARTAYLQVMVSNERARRLYAKFGFREAYAYWYRVLEAAPQEVPRGMPSRA
jgi:GNAT superfamily N-acetyltransferase